LRFINNKNTRDTPHCDNNKARRIEDVSS